MKQKNEKKLPCVIFIDDEEGILNSLRRLLRKEPYELILTMDPEVVLREVKEREVSVVVSDQRMPKMLGAELLGKVKKISPQTLRLMLTGYSDIKASMQAINEGNVFRFLTKPWEDAILKENLREAVRQFEIVKENEELNQKVLEKNEELTKLNHEIAQFNSQLEKKVEERTSEVRELNRKLEVSFLGSVKAIDSLAQVHSSAIGSHARRVTKLSLPIAKTLGIKGRELFEFQIAALLHDVGKVGVPSQILSKDPKELTPDEKTELSKHILRGEALIREIPNLENAAILVRHHHEHFNGKGGPDRLQGDAIPLGSRIISVVDAFDKAMNHGDSYSNENMNLAVDFLKNNCDTLFDPKVVEALLEHLDQTDDSEIEIGISELKPGMVVSRNVKNFEGQVICSQGTVLKPSTIDKIKNWLKVDPVIQSIYIERAKTVRKEIETDFAWG